MAAKLRSKEKERMSQLVKAREQITAATQKGSGAAAPMLEESDLDFLAQTKVQLS